MNVGKIFEQQWKKSIPKYALFYRLRDSAQSFGGGNLRFSSKNPFDCIMWDSQRHILYALELKTVQRHSISFERSKDDKGEIHFHQIKGLTEWRQYDGIMAGFVIEFREIEKTIFLDILDFNNLISRINKKSFNYNDLNKYRIKYMVIPQKKAISKYTYDVNYLLLNISFN